MEQSQTGRMPDFNAPDLKVPDLNANALAFAHADLRWRTLSAERQNWSEPQRMRTLAAAFLKYHAARLALDEAANTLACNA